MPSQRFVLLIALLNVAIHLVIAQNLGYHRDELLYFAQGLHPACGYQSVPPVTAWLAAAVRLTAGTSVFAVRLLPALGSGLLVWLVARLCARLGGSPRSRIFAAALVLLVPGFMRTFGLFQPVWIELLWWSAITLALLGYLATRRPGQLYLVGLLCGLAMLTKYLAALWIIALISGLALGPHRQLFKNPHLYGAFALALLVFSPNLIWQINRGFPVFQHLQELSSSQLANVDRLTFLSEQLLINFLAAPVSVLGLWRLCRSARYRFIGIAAVLVLIVLLAARGKSYYALGIYPVLLAAGSISLESIFAKKWQLAAAYGLAFLLTLPIVPIGMPVFKSPALVRYFSWVERHTGLQPGRRYEDGRVRQLPQDYADQIGWQELTAVTARAWRQVPDPAAAAIYAENYGQAAAIAVIGRRQNLPPPLSFSESFSYWVPRRFSPDLTSFIYINDSLGSDVAAQFATCRAVGGITDPTAREYGTTVYLCTRPRGSFNVFWAGVSAG